MPKSIGRVGSGFDPCAFFDACSHETATATRASIESGISLLPGTFQRTYASWCAQYVWSRLQALSVSHQKILQRAIELAQDEVAQRITPRQLQKAYAQVQSIGTRREQGYASTGGGGWFSQENCLIHAIRSVQYTCDLNPFTAAIESFAFAFEVIRGEAFLGYASDYDDEVQPFFMELRGLIADAYRQGIEAAHRQFWPVLYGTEPEVAQAVLIRESTREFLTRLLDDGGLEENSVEKITFALGQLAEIQEAEAFLQVAFRDPNTVNPAWWSLWCEAVDLRNLAWVFPAQLRGLDLPSVGSAPRPKKRKASKPSVAPLTTVGAGFDPACAFFPYHNPWDRKADWLQAMGDKYSYLLICAMVERFALPLYERDRPAQVAVAEAMREAIRLGRQMAESRSADEAQCDAIKRALSAYLMAEGDYLNSIPEGWREANRVARGCIQSALYCCHVVPDVWAMHSYLKSVVLSCFPFTPASADLKAYFAAIDDTGREFLRMAFEDAAAFAWEHHYPTLSGAYGMDENQSIVIATLYRHNMILLAQSILATNPSEAIQQRLSLADDAMRRIDRTFLYLNNLGKKPTQWKALMKNDEVPWEGYAHTMMAWQVLLSHHRSHQYSEVARCLRILPPLPKG